MENDRDARIHAWSSPRDPAPRRFHPRYGDRACFVGWIRPSTGGVPAQSEMVARYFALLASGKRKLPEDWLDRLATERTVEDELMSLGSCKTLVHHGPMIESLAAHVGCQVRVKDVLLNDPALFAKLVHAGQYPAQYRLRGPGADPALAREIVKEANIAWPVVPITLLIFSSLALSLVTGTCFGVFPLSW